MVAGFQVIATKPVEASRYKGVLDADAANKEWKENGIPAHMAIIDDSFASIKKVDQEKKKFL